MAAAGCSWSRRRLLRTVVKVRVIIIAGDRIKMHARVNEGYIIVLRGGGHRCVLRKTSFRIKALAF